jgi:FlaA1/EpsC-like NDP-sugar epimerase
MSTLYVGQATREDFHPAATLHARAIEFVKREGYLHRALLVLLAEIALAGFSYALAVSLFSEANGKQWIILVLRSTFATLILCRLAALASVRLYRRSMRYASLLDLISIAKGVTFSTILFWGIAWWQFGRLSIPAAVFLVDWAFLQLFWGGLHFGARILRTQHAAGRKAGKRVVIVGAGDAGMALLKELALDSSSNCIPVAIVDDKREKWGRTIYGVLVAGGTSELAKIASQTHADEILICIPSATRSQMRGILNACRLSGVPVRTLPSLGELMGGRVSRRDLRSPRVEDLLQREEIPVDAEGTRGVVGGKVVLVTGAGGSIGSELCRQIAQANPQKLLLLDRSENSLFYVNLEISEKLGGARVKPLLVDLLNVDRLREILREERPEVVFHAAAHKHVGMLELHPEEAIRNNVLGTRNIAEAAMECGATRFVNISTDKAVSPRNYMGLSKKMTELCIQELARKPGTCFSNVRFGNVAGSTGSVLRLFWDQIEKGGPIRVTDPRATRYFMSVPEAVHLILRAAALGKGGETFVFDMGEPLNIYELARTMMLFAGLKPDEDISIEFVGLKEGEKITEELWEAWEHPLSTECERIRVIREENKLSHGMLNRVKAMEAFLARGERNGLLRYIQEIGPEFRWNHTRETTPRGATSAAAPAAARAAAAFNTMGAA